MEMMSVIMNQMGIPVWLASPTDKCLHNEGKEWENETTLLTLQTIYCLFIHTLKNKPMSLKWRTLYGTSPEMFLS